MHSRLLCCLYTLCMSVSYGHVVPHSNQESSEEAEAIKAIQHSLGGQVPRGGDMISADSLFAASQTPVDSEPFGRIPDVKASESKFKTNTHESAIVILKHDISDMKVQEHHDWLATEFEVLNSFDKKFHDFEKKSKSILHRLSQFVFGRPLRYSEDDAPMSLLDVSSSSSSSSSSKIKIDQVYDSEGLKGYAGKFSKSALDKLKMHPDVALVEYDQPVYALKMQGSAPWGLARLSHTAALNLTTFNKYCFDERDGEGISVFIIDTGVFAEHESLKNRVTEGASFVVGQSKSSDGNGHGTHVAGIAAGEFYGVAQRAKIEPVKVLGDDGAGSVSSVLGGISWVINEHQTRRRDSSSKYKAGVVNMSLGGSKSEAMNQAVYVAYQAGLHFIVAAGNENSDACMTSPASSKYAITVGATDSSDTRASYSNFGPCVDIYAPGTSILSAWNGPGFNGFNRISGTSMATPHIAGLSAYLLSLHDDPSTVTPKQLLEEIRDLSTKGALKDVASEENYLAFNGYGAC